MLRSLPLWLSLVVGCGSTVVDDPDATSSGEGGSVSATTTSGNPTSVGSGSGGGVVGSASTADASSASSANGGGPGVTTSVGSGGAGGEPPATSCAGYDYCECVANEACVVVAEDCFCPCGVEPCEPGCDCDCGGGAYLGCAPSTIYNPGALEGIWLIGWGGGLNHYSWVRFEPEGRFTVRDGVALTANAPYYPCNGQGTWVFAEQPETIFMSMPPGCPASSLTFGPWTGEPAWPTGCLQSVVLEDVFAPDFSLTGCRFADDQCAPDMSSCVDPLGG